VLMRPKSRKQRVFRFWKPNIYIWFVIERKNGIQVTASKQHLKSTS